MTLPTNVGACASPFDKLRVTREKVRRKALKLRQRAGGGVDAEGGGAVEFELARLDA